LDKESLVCSKKLRARIIVSGRVQRVLFRDSIRRRADKAGVKGWVKNIKDGRVEAVLEGDNLALLRVIEWAHKGPFLAKVRNVDIIWEDYKGEFNDFKIIY
jgi:acylphosphatase